MAAEIAVLLGHAAFIGGNLVMLQALALATV